MILGNFRLIVLGVLVAGCAVPALAAAPESSPGNVDARSVASAGGQSRDASRSRRVELPFPLQFQSPERGPPAPVRRADPGPHPFRETLFKRASLFTPADLRLSRLPEFS